MTAIKPKFTTPGAGPALAHELVCQPSPVLGFQISTWDSLSPAGMSGKREPGSPGMLLLERLGISTLGLLMDWNLVVRSRR